MSHFAPHVLAIPPAISAIPDMESLKQDLVPLVL